MVEPSGGGVFLQKDMRLLSRDSLRDPAYRRVCRIGSTTDASQDLSRTTHFTSPAMRVSTTATEILATNGRASQASREESRTSHGLTLTCAVKKRNLGSIRMVYMAHYRVRYNGMSNLNPLSSLCRRIFVYSCSGPVKRFTTEINREKSQPHGVYIRCYCAAF